MSIAGSYTATEWIKYAFTATAMGTRPIGWTLHLHTADPGDTGANEVVGSGYAAQSVAFTQTAGSVANTAAVTFPTVATAAYTVSFVSIWDTAATPNKLWHGALAVPKTLNIGDALNFAIGDLIANII